METGAEGEVDAFPSPDALWAMTYPRPLTWRDRFAFSRGQPADPTQRPGRKWPIPLA